MTRTFLAGVLLLLSLAASPLAAANGRPELGGNARLWLNFVDVLAVDSNKPKFHIEYLDVAPGERRLALRSTHFGANTTILTQFRVTTALEPGHTYAVWYDKDSDALTFNDLGKDFVVPKLGMFYTSKKYRQALADARTQPKHPVVFIPTADWD